MKRVCTLRKVYRSFSKVLLEKLFFIVLISWLFIATQFLLSLSYLLPGDMIWNGNPKYLHEKKLVLLKFWYIYVSKFEETFICKREIDALPPIIRFAVFILLTEPSRIPLFNLLAIELLMAE